jgi:predicted benzoate:H+ symporter BenE
MSLVRDLSVSVVAAGFVTVLVGCASSAVIVFQAASAVGATEAQVGSWMLALGLGMGLTCILLSLHYRRRRIGVLGIGGGSHDPRDIAGGGRPRLTAARRSA